MAATRPAGGSSRYTFQSSVATTPALTGGPGVSSLGLQTYGTTGLAQTQPPRLGASSAGPRTPVPFQSLSNTTMHRDTT